MAKQITRWQAEDGSEFETRAEAEAHDAEYILKRLVLQRFQGRGREADRLKARKDVIDFLKENKQELYDLLGMMTGA